MIDTDTDDAPGTGILPLDAWHRAHGARMVEFAGYYMPIQYEGIIAEHLWTREHAGLFDVSHMGQLTVSGSGVVAALEAILPGDISALKEGRMRYSVLLNEDGGILDDLMITNVGEHLALVVNGAVKWDDIGFLREHLPDEVTLTHHDDQALVALQGPKAVDALSRLAPMAAGLKFMQAGGATWDGVPLYISRSGYTGEDGYEISLPAEHAEKFADALVSMEEVKPIGLGARDSLRLEAGLPLYGHDLTDKSDPVTSGLTFAISKRRREERGFHGADRILDLLANGGPTRRVGLALQGRMAAREGADVLVGETMIGTVTSGGFSPTLEHPIAMAQINVEFAETGTEVEIEQRGKRLAATVVKMPFVPQKYVR